MIEPLKLTDKDGDCLEAHCYEATKGRAPFVVLTASQDNDVELIVVELTVAQALQLRDWLNEFYSRSGE